MVLNLNVGILGHVDSGKTSLAKVLSEIASTASFDKNPQSQERGITLDLGFSSFQIGTPEHMRSQLDDENIQFTLVDCPGHASLIRTIIGGAQIIDMMLLVVDVTKGIQTQTAECIIIGELTCRKIIVVLNKIDLLPPDKSKQIEKVSKKLRNVLPKIIFGDFPIVSVAAHRDSEPPLGIDDLIQKISAFSFVPQRNPQLPFLMSVDHCFSIKGQGTVLTGTILQGTLQINDNIQIPSLQITKKVKTIQMFRKPVATATQGDRIGACVTQFDAKLFERGIICEPGVATLSHAAIISLQKIKYFKQTIKTKSKYHISIGHETVMATISCFSEPSHISMHDTFDFNREYNYCDELNEELSESNRFYAIVEFDKPVLTVGNSLVIGSKLDMDINTSHCRLAFWGTLLEISKDKLYKTTFLPGIKVFKVKSRRGVVERMVNDNEIIVKSMFKKDADLQKFVGLKVSLSSGEAGIIDGPFGQSGKIKVRVPMGFNEKAIENLQKLNKKKNDSGTVEYVRVDLTFKRYVFDDTKSMVQ